ncbi:response regulator [Methanogenium organophilum]|uniref:Response regulator n=1 Tax=Methanogenium organophilum TaxID=2199 RepID=A0A9X9S1D7_METOG|nr:response regulator [Methanogenium organophilum]WAI00123.1 response regulator [Methanogenium organophilum]
MEKKEKRSVGIVEDEGMIAMLLRELLTREGFDVVCTVKTGKEAVDCVRENTPEVMLMDINLKGDIDGIEAANQIREFSNIPIIFLSAYTDTQTKGRAEGVKPYAFLPKPINKQLLLSTITSGITG